MNEFKLKSIDEFDLFFSESLKSKQTTENAIDNLIPEMEAPTAKEKVIDDEFSAQETIMTDISSETNEKTPRPLTPIGQTPSPYAVADSKDTYSPEIILSEEDFEEEVPTKSNSKGILAGKIISIVMLCVTVVVFLLGCFTATFLDTFEIGGTNFSTLCSDIEALKLSQGDLLISKTKSANEYSINTFVVKNEVVNNGTEQLNQATIGKITAVTPYGDSSNLEMINLTTGNTDTITADECKGEVLFYIPFLAGILNFALQSSNAILVCALFVLLAAFWCLLLVLLSKASKKTEETEVNLINE